MKSVLPLTFLALFSPGLTGFTFSQQREAVSGPDKDLNYYITKGLASSPLLKDYKNQLLISRVDSIRLRASYGPQVTASTTEMYAPVIKGYGYDEVITNGQALDALLTVNYVLNGNGLKKNQLSSIRLQQDSIKYATRISELDLRKAITEQFITTYASQEQLLSNQIITELLRNEEPVLKKLTRANTYKQSEFLTFLVTFKQQELNYHQSRLQLKNDLAGLNYLTGIRDTGVVVLKAPDLQLSSELSSHLFFTRKFDIDSLKALNAKKAIDLNYNPKASFYVNGGYNSSLSIQPYRNFGSSAGFTLFIPVYDGHQRKLQHTKINLQQQTNSAYREFFEIQHKQQLDLLMQQIKATEELYAQLIDQLKFTQGLIAVDSKLMRTGEVRVADYVIAINNYLSTQNLYRQTSINRLKLINQFNYWNR